MLIGRHRSGWQVEMVGVVGVAEMVGGGQVYAVLMV